MKRGITIGIVIIALILAAALVVPSFIDWNKYKGQVLSQLQSATGYQYDISGPLQLSVLPTPHVVINGLTVKGQSGVALLTLDKAEVHVALLPLLSGRVDISSVTLDKPVFDFSIDKSGQASWLVVKTAATPAPVATPTAQAKPASRSIMLHALKIRDGAVRYTDARSGASYKAENIDLALNAESLTGPFGLKGNADYNGATIKIEGKSGAVGQGSDSVPVQVRMEVPSAKGSLEFSGMAGLKQPYAAQGQTTLEADDLDALLTALAGHAVTGYHGQAKLDGLLTYNASALKFENARVEADKLAMTGDLAVTGLQQQQPVIAASLKAAKPVDLDALMAQFGKPAARADTPGAAGSKSSSASGWLPASLKLPIRPMGKISVAAAKLVYKGQDFDNAALVLTMDGKSFVAQMQTGLPGNGTASGQVTLAFAGVTPDGKGVILTSPSASYKIQAKDQQPQALAALLPESSRPKVEKYLHAPIALDASGTVTNTALTVGAATVNAMNTLVSASGNYIPARNGKRARLAATIVAGDFDFDRVMGTPAPVAASEDKGPAAPRSAPDLHGFSLPFDLDLNASVRALHYKGGVYSGVNIKGGLAGSGLTLDTAGFRDAAGNSLSVSGVVGNIQDLSGIDMTVRGSTPDANALMTTLKLHNPIAVSIGEAALAVEAKGRADRLQFASQLRAMRGNLSASGVVMNAMTKPDFSALTFRLQHPNYEQLAQIFRPTFHAGVDIAKNLDIAAAMQKTGQIYAFDNMKATVGPSAMGGAVKIDMSGSVPALSASLQFTDLPLDRLLGTQASGGTDSGGGSQTIRAESTGRASGGGHWSRTPINTDWMRKWNADVKLTAGSASYGNWHFTNAAMDFALQNGALSLTKLTGGLYGGQIDMTAKMASGANGLDASSTMSLKNVSLESFAQSFMSSRLVKAQGAISLNASLAANGASPANLISTLGGKGALAGNDIVFQGFDLARVSTMLSQPTAKSLTANLGGALSGGSTHFDKLDGIFTVTNGIINFDRLALTGQEANVNSAGNINLPLWTVALTNVIALPAVNGKTPPPLKIAFNGPLDNPAQTFGKDALENFVLQQYGGKIQTQLGKLDKSGKLGGVLGAVLGVPQQQAPAAVVTPVTPVTAPATAPAAIPNTATDAAPAAIPNTAAPVPVQLQAEPAKKVKPKDILKGLLNNALQQQGGQ